MIEPLVDWWWLLMALVGFFHCRQCCYRCRICQDTFQRPDNTNISLNAPCQWFELGEGGDTGIRIEDEQLVIDDGNCRVIAKSDPGSPTVYVSAFAKITASADRPRIYVCYNTTNDDCYFMEVRATTMRIWSRIGGSETELGQVTVSRATDTFYHLSVCVSLIGGVYYLTGNFNGTTLTVAAGAIPGNRWGVGNHSLASAEVIYSSVYCEHVGGSGNLCANCRECSNACTSGTVPEEFEIVVSLTPNGNQWVPAGNCDDMEGTYYAQYAGTRRDTTAKCSYVANAGGAWGYVHPVSQGVHFGVDTCVDAASGQITNLFDGHAYYADMPIVMLTINPTLYGISVGVVFTTDAERGGRWRSDDGTLIDCVRIPYDVLRFRADTYDGKPVTCTEISDLSLLEDGSNDGQTAKIKYCRNRWMAGPPPAIWDVTVSAVAP